MNLKGILRKKEEVMGTRGLMGIRTQNQDRLVIKTNDKSA